MTRESGGHDAVEERIELGEAGLLLASVLCLAVGTASIPDAAIAIVGGSKLITGSPPGEPYAIGQLTETVRNHLLCGVAGFIAFAAWWVLHLRRTRPALLPSRFALAVCVGSSIAVAAAFLGVGLLDTVRRRYLVAGGMVGAGDLIATGATVAAAAALCWFLRGRQVTRVKPSA